VNRARKPALLTSGPVGFHRRIGRLLARRACDNSANSPHASNAWIGLQIVGSDAAVTFDSIRRIGITDTL
jgi:hypothetical protein